MRFLFALVGIAALLFLGAWALGLVTLDQTRVAEAPAVRVEGGQAPAFSVNVAKVELGTENKTVAVPTVRVTKPAPAPDADNRAPAR